MVILDGFNFTRKFHTFGKSSLTGFQNFVGDGVLDAGQEQLVLEKLCHFVDAFSLGLIDGGTSKPDGGHGGGLVVNEALVGDLDSAAIIVHTFFRVLLKIREIGTDHLG